MKKGNTLFPKVVLSSFTKLSNWKKNCFFSSLDYNDSNLISIHGFVEQEFLMSEKENKLLIKIPRFIDELKILMKLFEC